MESDHGALSQGITALQSQETKSPDFPGFFVYDSERNHRNGLTKNGLKNSIRRDEDRLLE